MGKKKEVVVSAAPKAKKEAATTESASIKKTKTAKKVVKRQRGAAYLKAKNLFLHEKAWPLNEALALIAKVSFEKFNASVELHLNLNENGIKGEVSLPHGTGKTVKVLVFDEQIEKDLQNNKISFDILVAHPKDMPKLVKFAKLLGPKGLMPSPKRGTLTEDTAKAVKKLSSGTINFRSEPKFPLLHQVVGKRDFTAKQLEENIKAFIAAVNPKYIEAAYLKTSMSPVIKLSLDSLN